VETHHLTVDEAVAIQHTAGDCRILYAEAHLLRHTCILLGELASVSDMELLDAYAPYHAEVGETAEAIPAVLADGRITPAEFARVDREMLEDVQAKFGTGAGDEGQAGQGRPACLDRRSGGADTGRTPGLDGRLLLLQNRQTCLPWQ